MKQYIWITEPQALAIHNQQLAWFGGAPGVLDSGKLSSALARPRQIQNYNVEVNIYQLAAAYGWGLVKNHPFVDGNKRVAFVVMAVFLKVNGIELKAQETDVVTTMVALAASEMSESQLSAWLQKSSTES